ncbi:MAG: superfamily II DNA/RNA helicase [Bacteriovoracaceae bacterium]|jgi:superfamily II DNA/RNA helicase
METNTPFTEFELKPELLASLKGIGFENASPVQEMTIAPVLDGKDIFAQAETGSGKTGSFAIPIIEQILRDEELMGNDKRKVSYVVLSPTRELAQQTQKVFTQIGTPLGITSTCLIGGENIDTQKGLLKEHPFVLIATPGRLVDLIKQKCVDLIDTKGVVFDEADRLFDMGFKKDIEFILSKMSDHRQLIMVSATSNMDVLNTAYKFRSHPVELRLNADSLLVDHIDHSLAMVTGAEKMPLLVKMLRDIEDAYALVFCNTQFMTHVVAEWLTTMEFKAKPISGRLAQNKRTKLMEEFRAKKITILVCTDVAARGLDIKDVNFVVNYDLPQEAANYVHRIGRTGRAGANGKAVSFCAHEDCEYLDPISELIGSKIPRMELTDESFAKNLPKKPYIDYKTLQVVDRNASREGSRDRKDRNDRKDSRGKSSTKKDFKDEKPPVFKPYELLETPTWVESESKDDKRIFVTTTKSLDQAQKNALGYYRVNDASLLKWDITKQGPKKFFFFGPRSTTYKFTLKPIYKKLLLPFLMEMVKISRLNVFVKVNFDKDKKNININFSGSDERLFSLNDKELLFAYEQLVKVYVTTRVHLPGNIRINMSFGKNGPARAAKAADRNDKGEGRERGSKRTSSRGRDKIDEAKITGMVDKMVEKVLDSSKPVTLNAMNSAERRIVHQHLHDDKKVQTTSLGDGRYKKIQISLR